MTDFVISKEEMLETHVARFEEIKPFPRAFLDTVVPEFKRDIFSIIGAGVLEDSEMKPEIADPHPFSLGLIRMEPGQGAGLHAHTTEEVFIPLNGKMTIIWGDEGENEIELDEWDVCSVPIGVMRGFRNSDDHTVVAMALNGGDDSGRLTWSPGLAKRAKEFGGKLNDDGYFDD
jgi:mannose-6-phosphate isomerase-like protein (cupin superfamily)